MGYTKKETDFWGNEKEVHYDDSGSKVGETRFRETFFGNTVQEHYDSSGSKVGETRREEGFFGDKAAHYDSSGSRVGYTKDDTTIFGDKIQRHYDNSGNSVGKSRYEEGLFGGSKKVHEGEYFKGESPQREKSNSYTSRQEEASAHAYSDDEYDDYDDSEYSGSSLTPATQELKVEAPGVRGIVRDHRSIIKRDHRK
jgi:hypothetical protein